MYVNYTAETQRMAVCTENYTKPINIAAENGECLTLKEEHM
jgi:hypothetical protein